MHLYYCECLLFHFCKPNVFPDYVTGKLNNSSLSCLVSHFLVKDDGISIIEPELRG